MKKYALFSKKGDNWRQVTELTEAIDYLYAISLITKVNTKQKYYRRMKLASHNSFTYFKVRGFWNKFINWTAKCQRKTIKEQYEDYDVRMFDLRVWFDEDMSVVFNHGIVKYRISPDEMNNLLAYLDDKGDCWCRVILEENNTFKKKSYAERNENYFCYYCERLEKLYPNIKFYGGKRKYDWKDLYKFKESYPNMKEYNKSGLWPWWGAFWGNKKYYKNHTDENQWAMLDFIDIK